PQEDYLNGVVGDKGIYSTVIDLYKFDRALYSNILIEGATLKEAFNRTVKNRRKPDDDYGMGFRLKRLPGNEYYTPYHSGWWRGFKTLFIRDIHNDRTIIMLCNRDISPQSQLIWNLLDFM